jgi:hypothetical protein
VNLTQNERRAYVRRTTGFDDRAAEDIDYATDPTGWLEAHLAGVAEAELEEMTSLASLTDEELDRRERAAAEHDLDWLRK